MDPLFSTQPFNEPVPLLAGQPFIGRAFHKPTFGAVWHRHPEIELTLVQSGWGVCNIGNRIEPFQANNLYLIGPDLPHAFVSHPATEPTSWLVLQFRTDYWGKDFWVMDGMQKISRMLSASEGGLAFTLSPESSIKHLAFKLCAEGSIGQLIQLLEELSHCKEVRAINSDALQSGRQSPHPKITQVIRLVEKQATGDISQKAIADQIGMSPQAFSRFFHHHTGRTFQHFCNEIRIAHVCADLKAGDRSITDAAYAAGFKNIANFCRRFKQITGLTPRDYRASLQINALP